MDLVERMDMGSSSPHSCKISMLWNWYTIDSCFIARSWHVTSKGMFAGSCIGVFLLVVASQWLARVGKEFNVATNECPTIKIDDEDDSTTPVDVRGTSKYDSPLVYVLSHKWLFKSSTTSFPNHLIKCLIFTVEWGLSYLIMLLFMYYNGYIIISCIIGAFVGKLMFGFGEPDGETVDCCKH